MAVRRNSGRVSGWLSSNKSTSRNDGVRYAVNLTTDDNGTILVTVPDLPEAITFGEDREDAIVRAADAIETAWMAAMAAREDIAEPKTHSQTYVDLNALTSAKVALYRAMRAERIGKAALA